MTFEELGHQDECPVSKVRKLRRIEDMSVIICVRWIADYERPCLSRETEGGDEARGEWASPA